jgi:hypothetical protein
MLAFKNLLLWWSPIKCGVQQFLPDWVVKYGEYVMGIDFFSICVQGWLVQVMERGNMVLTSLVARWISDCNKLHNVGYC